MTTPAPAIDWEARYRAQDTPWDRGATSPALTRWLAQGVLPAGRALVPGCGNGHEVLTLARAGWQVTAVDLAASALANLSTRLSSEGLTAQLVEADLLDWRAQTQFDLVYEQTILCAMPPTHWPAYTRHLAEWTQPGGTLAALFMQTGAEGGPPYHCDLQHMRTLFPATAWRWPETAPGRVTHSSERFEYALLLQRCDVPDPQV